MNKLHLLGLMVLCQAGSPLEDVARAIAHPVVVCIGSRGNLLQTFVVLEGQVTECPSLLSAVDRAFKLHFIFNIAYVSASEHVWQLLQKLAYTIHENSSTYACVTDLITYTRSKRRRIDL